MRKPSIRNQKFIVLIMLLTSTPFLVAQAAKTLSVAGQPGSAKVVQVGGVNYVEVEGLARLTNSSVSFNQNQIVLNPPGSAASAPATAAPAGAPAGFSKQFVTAGIEAMAEVREWRAALKNAIERGYPLAAEWLESYRAQSRQAVKLAEVAASTASDKGAVPFLTNEFNNMGKLTDKYLQMTKSMTYIDPNSFESDPLNQKIITCGRSLAAMATVNQLIDDGTCH